jgi:hypothetical protein
MSEIRQLGPATDDGLPDMVTTTVDKAVLFRSPHGSTATISALARHSARELLTAGTHRALNETIGHGELNALLRETS